MNTDRLKVSHSTNFKKSINNPMCFISFYLPQDKLERLNSGNNLDSSSPRKVLIEQLHRVLPSDDSLPDQVMCCN